MNSTLWTRIATAKVIKNSLKNDMLFFKTGYEWVGWQNKTNALRLGLLELTFEFEGVRNFSRIDVFVNNDYHKHIQVGSSYFQDAYFYSTCHAMCYMYMYSIDFAAQRPKPCPSRPNTTYHNGKENILWGWGVKPAST